MNGTNNERFTAAEFRVRLFLSVDLSGSTAFKNSHDGEQRERASPRWVTIFETFYRDFPAKFRSQYQEAKTSRSGKDNCPSLWKAVGDELVFCGRVSNRNSVMTSLMAFIDTLHAYRKLLSDENIPLNVKGAGWLATFPEPNRAVQLRNLEANENFLTASEALESAADKQPFEYDFLGKAIDTGFRVASLAKPERFALSVQLARLLASSEDGSGFDHWIRLDLPTVLRGVNGGEGYPVLYIDTLKHLNAEGIRLKERQLLKQYEAPSKADLSSYLEAYCKVVGTDEILLPLTANDPQIPPPENYTNHKAKISEHLEAERGREISEAQVEEPEDGNGGEIPEGQSLEPLLSSSDAKNTSSVTKVED